MFKIMRILLGVFLILFTMSVYSNAEETWKITSLNWEPYSGDTLTSQGNSIQKFRELLRQNGIRLLVEFYPWLRAQKKAKTKEYVGYFPAWPEEVAEGFIASLPVDWSEVGLMKKSDENITFKSIDDLVKKYKVGIVKTYIYPQEIADALKKYPKHADGSPNELSLLKKLGKGRIKVAVTDPNVMLYLAAKEGIDNIELIKVVMKKELVVALRNDDENKSRINLLKKLLKAK
jgi:polar amino acid transport system substrate-binding protein